MVIFSVLQALVGLIPEAMNIVNYVFNLFGGYLAIGIIDKIINPLRTVITFAETIMFIVLGFKAFSQETVSVPAIYSFVNKNI